MPKRAAALLGAIFFLLTIAGEAVGFHPCPHLGGDEAPTTEHAAHEDALVSGGHDGHSADHADTAGSDGHHHADCDRCTESGMCQPPAGAAVAEYVVVAVVWLSEITHEPTPAPTTWVAPAAFPPFFLPYSLAPPADG